MSKDGGMREAQEGGTTTGGHTFQECREGARAGKYGSGPGEPVPHAAPDAQGGKEPTSFDCASEIDESTKALPIDPTYDTKSAGRP